MTTAAQAPATTAAQAQTTPRPPAAAAAAPTSPAAPTAAPTGSRFVAVVRAQLPEVAADRTDEDVRQIAVRACQGLAEGRSSDEIVDEARTLGTLDGEATDAATARELVKLAIDTECLDQATRVDEF